MKSSKTYELPMQNYPNNTQRKNHDDVTHRTVGLLVGGLCIAAFVAMLLLRSSQTLGGI